MRKSIAIAHPGMAFGGSEMTALWMIEALKDDFDITFLTAAPVKWERLNVFCGTNLDPGRIDVLKAQEPFLLKMVAIGDTLRSAYWGRFCRAVGPKFDLCISVYNFVDFGHPSIQFLADFTWDEEIRRAFDPPSTGLRGVLNRPNPVRWPYLAIADIIRGGTEDVRVHADDVIISNSHWSADLLARRHGLFSSVIYPPVDTRTLKGIERSSDFIILGRINPQKRVIEAIDVLSQVRARGHRLQFHILGDLDGSDYSERVKKHAARCGDWVRLPGLFCGDKKFAELERHAFGLHTRRGEAFGIAVAEMLKMGIVPFVPANSAPAEIVDDDRLVFDNPDHAVDVIDRALKDADQIADIRKHLAGRADLFSTERFVREVREVIEEVLCSGNSHTRS